MLNKRSTAGNINSTILPPSQKTSELPYSYVLLELLPTAVIVWTELSCWRKSYSSKSRSGWPLQNIHISNNNGSFYFLRRLLSFLFHCQDFYRTWLFILVTWRIPYKKQELPTLRQHLSSPPIFWLGSFCSSF